MNPSLIKAQEMRNVNLYIKIWLTFAFGLVNKKCGHGNACLVRREYARMNAMSQKIQKLFKKQDDHIKLVWEVWK